MPVTLTSNEEIDLGMISLINQKRFEHFFLNVIDKEKEMSSTCYTVKSIIQAEEKDFLFIKGITGKEDYQVKEILPYCYIVEAVSVKPVAYDSAFGRFVKPIMECKGLLRIDKRPNKIRGRIREVTKPIPQLS